MNSSLFNTSQHGIRTLWGWLLGISAVWLFQFFAVDQLDPYYYTIILYSGINIILAVSLNLVTGFTGQFSIGHAGFMAVGAYLSAFLTSQLEISHPAWIQDPVFSPFVFLVALLLGGLGAAFIGFWVGLPSLRLKGDYLAIVTLGFGEIIRVVILNMDVVGGARGLPNIPALSNFGWIYTFVLLTVLIIGRLIRSSQGRAFLAVREDEIAAEAMGVNTTSAKVTAFAIGAFFAGVAGGLFAHHLRYLNPQTFDFNKSFEIIIMVVLGGMGSLSGSVIAAVFLTCIKEALRPLQEITKLDFRMVIYSLMLIFLMLMRPQGIMGSREFSFAFLSRLGKRFKRRQPTP